MRILLRTLVVFFFLISAVLPGSGQDLMLAEVLTGNPDRINSDVVYKWSVDLKRADANGGLLYLNVVPKTEPQCRRTYQIGWRFSKNISSLRFGETVSIDFENLASGVPAGCHWDFTSNCPSKVTVNGRNGGGIGPSAFIYEKVMADPTQGFRAYVFFSPFPGIIVEGDPQFHQKFNYVFYQRGRSWVKVGGTTQRTLDFARQASGGSFVIIVGDRGVKYHIVYNFTRGGSSSGGGGTTRVQPNQPVSLGNPIIRHNMLSQQQVYWMEIRVPGVVRNAVGKRLQLVMRFMDARGNLLPAHPSELTYRDARGYAASGSPVFAVNSAQFDLSGIQLWMPYYALNLPNTGGRQNHTVSCYAEVFLDNVSVGRSPVQSFNLRW